MPTHSSNQEPWNEVVQVSSRTRPEKYQQNLRKEKNELQTYPTPISSRLSQKPCAQFLNRQGCIAHRMKALDAEANNPDSGFWSSRIATTAEECPAPAPTPASADSDEPAPPPSGTAIIRLNSLKAFRRSGTFRMPKAIVNCYFLRKRATARRCKNHFLFNIFLFIFLKG